MRIDVLTALAAAMITAPAWAHDGCGGRSAANDTGIEVAQALDKARDAASDKAMDAARDKAGDALKDQAVKGDAPPAGTPTVPGGPAMPGTATSGAMPGGGLPTTPGGPALPGTAGVGGVPGRDTPAGDVPKPPSGY